MSTTDPVTSSTAAGANPQPKKSRTDLDMNSFLTLMTAQLQNQDPLKPLDSTEFVAQLAQFSTVSGIQSMENSLATLTDSMRSSQALSGATLVGHDVLVPAEEANYAAGTVLGGAVEVPKGASGVALGVYDSGGQLVRQAALPTDAGLAYFAWDGLADDGSEAASGRYTVKIIATVDGHSESLQPQLLGTVGSVSIARDGTSLTLNTRELGAVALRDVTQVM
jgi:flagellar basal-body rod modification protein FlgD